MKITNDTHIITCNIWSRKEYLAQIRIYWLIYSLNWASLVQIQNVNKSQPYTQMSPPCSALWRNYEEEEGDMTTSWNGMESKIVNRMVQFHWKAYFTIVDLFCADTIVIIKKIYCLHQSLTTMPSKLNCDRAYENQPCERKLHRVIFSLISFILNALSHFRKLQKKAH